jgi:hypothetical protein
MLGEAHIHIAAWMHLAWRNGERGSVIELWLTAAEEDVAVRESEEMKAGVLTSVP